MPKNVMKMIKPVAQHGSHDFDLSHRHLYGMNMGELLPSTFIETVPGDFIQLHASNLLRAIPLVTSPFLRVKQHLDVWFVPYNDLWSQFGAFMTRKKQPQHSNGLNSQYAPYASMYDIDALTVNTTDTDVVGRNYAYGATKLIDLCGYGTDHILYPDVNTAPKVNLWRIAAYNKIWYEEYRQKYYDNGMRLFTDQGTELDEINAAGLFNFDDVNCISVSTANIDSSQRYTDYQARLKAMFQLRYRTWKKDLLTGVMPSTQFGAVSAVDLGSETLSNLILQNHFATNSSIRNDIQHQPMILNGFAQASVSDRSVRRTDFDDSLDNFAPQWDLGKFTSAAAGDPSKLEAFNVATASGLSILELRQAEALQIWRENALRAGNRISDNFRAHYGDDAEYNDHRCVLLGSISAPLNIGDIDAQAQTGSTGNAVLGSIAGKGTSTFNDKVFKFKAKEFGVIVAIHSLLPETEYESTGIDRMNQLLEYEDYFVPEFENLGLEAVSSLNFMGEKTTTAKIFGYAPRYYGYKQKLDKVFKAFHYNGNFYQWASPRYDITQMMSSSWSAIPLSILYVNPALYDYNFAVGIANSDQILCDIYYDVDAVRKMNIIGLPNS